MSQKQFPAQKLPQFALNPITKDTKLASFEINYHEILRQGQNVKSIIPTFNLDKLYYTPTFVLPIDKNYYAQNQVYQRCQFQDKIQHELESITIKHIQRGADSIKVAVPQNHYCQICKQKFDDYDSHIDQRKHFQASQYNSINQRIKQLCVMFETKKERITANMKKKAIKKPQRRTCNKQNSRKDRAINKVQKKPICNTSSSEANESIPQNTK